MTENVVWKTEAEPRNAWDIVENVVLTLDDTGEVMIQVVQSTEQTEDVSLPKTLSLKEAIGLGVALIRSAGCMEVEEDD